MEEPLEEVRLRGPASIAEAEEGGGALLNREQIARALGVCERTISEWQKRKMVPYLKLSPRMIRFLLPEVIHELKRFQINAVK
jgi:hypothetical protein